MGIVSGPTMECTQLNTASLEVCVSLHQIFSRVLRSFQLPVGPKELRAASSKDQLNTGKAAALVVCMLVGQ